ncbi:MAG: 50S ribosomal protein L17 [Candidatus Omnitrophica bacterium]|nr:50S ribosomal protein L17 [Candidatus Omnitrophota bacterium]
MRHRKSRFRLNRFTSWRKSTLISLAKNLLIHQSIKTTKTKALAVRPLVEKLITLAKLNTLAAKRRAYKILSDHRQVKLLFDVIGERFSARKGGYTRIFNLGFRRGDNAKMVVLELTEIKKKERKLDKKEQEIKSAGEKSAPVVEEKPIEEKKPKAKAGVKEKPPVATKKSLKKFLGGVRGIFKKQRGSL